MMCFSHASLALGPPTLKIDAPFQCSSELWVEGYCAHCRANYYIGVRICLIPWKIFCGSDQGERFNVAESLSPKVRTYPHIMQRPHFELEIRASAKKLWELQK